MACLLNFEPRPACSALFSDNPLETKPFWSPAQWWPTTPVEAACNGWLKIPAGWTKAAFGWIKVFDLWNDGLVFSWNAMIGCDQTYGPCGKTIPLCQGSHIAAKFPANRPGECVPTTNLIPGGHLSPLVPIRWPWLPANLLFFQWQVTVVVKEPIKRAKKIAAEWVNIFLKCCKYLKNNKIYTENGTKIIGWIWRR